jgi:hypothetical protein
MLYVPAFAPEFWDSGHVDIRAFEFCPETYPLGDGTRVRPLPV